MSITEQPSDRDRERARSGERCHRLATVADAAPFGRLRHDAVAVRGGAAGHCGRAGGRSAPRRRDRRGVLLATILRAVLTLHGVLMDREAVVATARAHVDAAGVGERSECHGGDFFASVPAGADGYLLSRILHDWDDDDAVRILATCRAAMQPSSRLLVVEAVIPERARDAPAAPDGHAVRPLRRVGM